MITRKKITNLEKRMNSADNHEVERIISQELDERLMYLNEHHGHEELSPDEEEEIKEVRKRIKERYHLQAKERGMA